MRDWSWRKNPDLVGVTVVVVLEDFSVVCSFCVFHIDSFSAKWSKIICFYVLIRFIGSLNGDKLPPLVWFIAFGLEEDFGSIANFRILDLHEPAWVGLNNFIEVVVDFVNFKFLVGIASKLPQTSCVFFSRVLIQWTVQRVGLVHCGSDWV